MPLVDFLKGVTCSAPGITTTSTVSSNHVEIESFSIDNGTQEFEDNNDIARTDDYILQEESSKRYGTLTISGKGTFPDPAGSGESAAGLGSYGAITISKSSTTLFTGYGVVQNFKNDLNSRQKPVFSVTYQIVPQRSTSDD